MKRKQILILTAILILASGILLAFNTNNQPSPCNESTEKCCKKKDENPQGGAVWESLSRQFLTSSGF